MTKAPNAAEKPALTAIITIARQRPKEMISKVSSFSSCLAFFRKVGIR